MSVEHGRMMRLLVVLVLLTTLMPMSATAAEPRAASVVKAGPKPPAGSALDAAGNPYVAGQILVRFDSSAGVSAQASAHRATGATKIKDVSGLSGLQLAKLPKGMSIETAIARYKAQPGVAYAQPNYLHHIDAVPSDPRFGELWGMNNTGQTGGTPDADIDAPEAWDTQTGSSDVVVAVIDTGVDYNHPDLAANIWSNPGEIPGNGIDDDGNGFVDDVHGYDFFNFDGDPMDDHSHGTHCSGTIGAAADNGIGVAGVTHDVRIMALKFLSSEGWGDTAAAIECINYADMMGADIMSNSWGGGPYEQALADAIAGTDALFVAAAGNDSMDTDASPNYPSCYDSPNVVAVGATDHNDQIAWFSNWGAETVDLFAPGEEVLSTIYGPPPAFAPNVLNSTPVSDCSDLTGWDASDYARTPWSVTTERFVSGPSSFGIVDYKDDEQAWLKSPALDLSGYTTAAMRCQVYYDLEEGVDTLDVWASTNGIDWSPLASYTGYSNGFQQKIIDLSGFAGSSTVYLGFSLWSDGSISSDVGLTGVGIDDIEIVELDTVYTERFDDLADWDTSQFANTAWNLNTTQFASGPSSAGHIPYGDNEDAWLKLTTPIDLSGVSGGLALSCNVFYEIEPGGDYLRAFVATDGATWSPVATYTGFNSMMGGQFTQANIDLSSVAGESNVLLAFQLESNDVWSSADGLTGVAIDDLNLVTGTWTAPDYSDAYAYFSGTSMATPHIAGIAALALSEWPTLDAPMLKRALIEGADPVAALDGMCVSGGRANAYNSIQDMFGPNITADAVDEYSAKATITLSADDPNGVDWIAYSFDGDDPTYVYDTTAIAVCSVPGDRVLTYWGKDGLGNIGDPQEVSFHITRGATSSKVVAGADRFATAVKASQISYPDGADTVIIATGRNWPDALGGTALAGAVDGPMLLVENASVPAAVAAEIERLGANSAYILGGASAVSDEVVEEIEDVIGAGNATRISGADRYATARLIADEVIALQGSEYDGIAFVATGANYPDALAAAPAARYKGYPLLLADPAGAISVPYEVSSAVILGGESAVPAGIEAALQGRLGEANVVRKGASDRYGTAALIASWSVARGMYWEGAGIATGTNFADALAGGAMLGSQRSVLLLTPGTALAPAARAPLSVNKDMIQTVYFVGGTSAVSQTVRDQVMAAID